jgi:hypothetical protein
VCGKQHDTAQIAAWGGAAGRLGLGALLMAWSPVLASAAGSSVCGTGLVQSLDRFCVCICSVHLQLLGAGGRCWFRHCLHKVRHQRVQLPIRLPIG